MTHTLLVIDDEPGSRFREVLILSTGTSLLPEFLPIEVQQGEADVADVVTDLSTQLESRWQGLAEFVDRGFQERPPLSVSPTVTEVLTHCWSAQQ